MLRDLRMMGKILAARWRRFRGTAIEPDPTPDVEYEPVFRRPKKKPLTSFVQLFEAPTEGMEPEYMLRDLRMMGKILAARWRRFRERRQ